MKSSILPTFFLLFLLIFSCRTTTQPYVQAINRVVLQNNDTLTEFYAVKLNATELRRAFNLSRRYHWYDGNAIQVTQGGASGRMLDGKYVSYYPNHNLLESGSFSNGLKDGEWKTWYAEGVLKGIQTWKEGILHGAFSSYDSSGKIKEQLTYSKGTLSGEQLYYRGDTVFSKVIYKKGKVVLPTIEAGDSVNVK